MSHTVHVQVALFGEQFAVYLPAAQAQPVRAVLPTRPLGHCEHSFRCAVWYLPASHAMHAAAELLWPLAVPYVPAPHSVQEPTWNVALL